MSKKIPLSILIGVTVSLIIGWIWGVQTVREHIFPFELAYQIRDIVRGQSVVRKEKAEIDISHISTNLKRLKENIYTNGVKIRKALMTRLVIPSTDIKIRKEKVSKSVDRIVASFYGITIVGILAKSDAVHNQCLIIYNQGHEGGGNPFDFEYHNKIRATALSRNCDFLSLSMLGLGLNEGPVEYPSTVNLGDGYFVKLDTHQAKKHGNYSIYQDEKYPNLEPLAIFLSGHYRIISDLASQYSRTTMIGISGGGWYTTMLSALIPQIDTSVSIAGSVPLIFITNPENSGDDYESIYAPLWNDYDYWHFYFLGLVDKESNPTRHVFLIYNNADPCCFSDPSASSVKRILDSVGDIQVIIHKSQKHEINVEMAKEILFASRQE